MEFIKKYKDIILIFFIIIFSLFIRIYLIDKIPINITGDESWDISNIYRIVFTNLTTPLTLMGDGSVPAVVFYPVALLIKIFGITNSILFLRINIIIYSLLSLVAFYFILKDKTSTLIAFLFTLLLSANYVFLNFSRTAWVNMMCLFSGLFLIHCLEKGFAKSDKKWFMLAGIFAGISMYGYHFGRILVAFTIIYLIVKSIKDKLNLVLFKNIFFFLFTFFIISLPFLLTLLNAGEEPILRRPSSTFVFSKEKINESNLSNLLSHQIEYSLRGLIILDPSITNEGVENSRYVPLNHSPVNIFIKLLFIPGLIYFIIKKRYGIWIIVLISVLFTQIISDLPPNFSRGLFYLPFIYLISAVFLSALFDLIVKRYNHKNVFTSIIIIICLISVIYDVRLYFTWSQTEYIYNARQPGIDYNEFSTWQDYQINLVKTGNYPITNNTWYEIRKSLIEN